MGVERTEIMLVNKNFNTKFWQKIKFKKTEDNVTVGKL
jgi:hypothetical protein